MLVIIIVTKHEHIREFSSSFLFRSAYLGRTMYSSLLTVCVSACFTDWLELAFFQRDICMDMPIGWDAHLKKREVVPEMGMNEASKGSKIREMSGL